jgi:hypothetical protein
MAKIIIDKITITKKIVMDFITGLLIIIINYCRYLIFSNNCLWVYYKRFLGFRLSFIKNIYFVYFSLVDLD